MSSPPITELLRELREGRGASAERLAEAVHGKLQAIAQRELAARFGGRSDQLTIEPGVLADDALMKVLDLQGDFANRRHFYAYATRIMVRALIDYHRQRTAQKRGGGMVRVTLTRVGDEQASSVDVEQLPPLLDELRELDERKAEIVQLRVFWGMTVAEVAEVMQVSPSTVDRDWRFAQRWLANRLRS
ncbi:MAG: hypothetical protein DWQ36_17010 [Acidobacteria bacterium]|nr:MAG: hypothetical protein DWQ30_05105 [Acidobacteriota bacterium]REK04551.1 MAG: hypothetical protein DWQ36_17010 [Acidobacteriota bacterium]